MAIDVSRHPILVVEDSPQDVALLRRAFQKAGVVNPLYVVGHGDDAIAYLSGRGAYADREAYPFPELVLLDLKLPRRSGHEILGWIRATPGLARLPVVVLTSSREDSDVQRAYDLGANSYLVKPASFDNLRRMVEALQVYWMVFNTAPRASAVDYVGELP